MGSRITHCHKCGVGLANSPSNGKYVATLDSEKLPSVGAQIIDKQGVDKPRGES